MIQDDGDSLIHVLVPEGLKRQRNGLDSCREGKIARGKKDGDVKKTPFLVCLDGVRTQARKHAKTQAINVCWHACVRSRSFCGFLVLSFSLPSELGREKEQVTGKGKAGVCQTAHWNTRKKREIAGFNGFSHFRNIFE